MVGVVHRFDADQIVAKLDAVSRQRSLTDDESRVLEHFLKVQDGEVSLTARVPCRSNITLARLGFRRRA